MSYFRGMVVPLGTPEEVVGSIPLSPAMWIYGFSPLACGRSQADSTIPGQALAFMAMDFGGLDFDPGAVSRPPPWRRIAGPFSGASEFICRV